MNIDTSISIAIAMMQKVKWRDYEDNKEYEWYYAENNLYVLHSKTTDAYWFIKAKSPQNAYDCLKGKIN